MASRTRIANEAWEALFRAQATIAQELGAEDVWDGLSPREYGVLYALSGAPHGLRITAPRSDVLLPQPRAARPPRRAGADAGAPGGGLAGDRGGGSPGDSSNASTTPTTAARAAS